MGKRVFSAVFVREGDGFVAQCPDLDVFSQGDTLAEAQSNLQEAVELFLESADPTEVERRLKNEVYVTPLEVDVG